MVNKMAFGPIDRVDIKVKTITGTTPSAQGDTLTVGDVGIEASKITAIICGVHPAPGDSIPPEFTGAAGHNYSVWIGSVGLQLRLASSASGSILNTPFTVLVYYS